MNYSNQQVAEFLKVYFQFESESKNFLFLSASSLKNKEHAVKSASATLIAIENYKKLPIKLRQEIERDKNANASKIIEIEKICKEMILKNK